MHREHRNKPSDPKYGDIIHSMYNNKMKRIELIIGLDNDKCQDILEEQEKRGYTCWSMACRVDADKCSWCGHISYNNTDRCEHIPVKLGHINEDGVMCGMVNIRPKWFEISYVKYPADRIGVSLKLASDSRIRPLSPEEYLKIYPDFELPEKEKEYLLISKYAAEKRNLAKKLADIEKQVDAVSTDDKVDVSSPAKGIKVIIIRQGLLNQTPDIPDEIIEKLREFEPPLVFRGLARRGIIFSPFDFIRYLLGKRIKEPEILLPGMRAGLCRIYTTLASEPIAPEILHDEKYEPEEIKEIPKELKEIIEKLTSNHSLFPENSQNRILMVIVKKGSIHSLPKPEIRKPTKAEIQLALEYTKYKLAALNYIQQFRRVYDDTLFLVNFVLQNRK